MPSSRGWRPSHPHAVAPARSIPITGAEAIAGSGVPARLAALRLLDGVFRQGQPLEAGLDRAAAGLAPRDRALAHALAAAVLRWCVDLDVLIDSATRQRLADDAKARMVLRLGLAQALVLGTPGHAAVATVLPLVEGGPRRLVHGVLGTLLRRDEGLPDRPHLPERVAARWRAAWGDAMVAAAEHALATPAPIDLSAKPGIVPPDPAAIAPDHCRVPAATAVTDLAGWAEGDLWVQDLAASIPARLLGEGAGEALDLCAAPGGKTLQLAAAGWAVTAVDASASRLARLRENLDRTGLVANVVTADLRRWQPDRPADAVLLDAPCSATGIFRRHPDVLYRARPAIIAEMAALQAELLALAADWVRPGGRLVYAVCSLEPSEGEDRLAAFLAERPDYTIDPVEPCELPQGIAPVADGTVRTLPGHLPDRGRVDGFFVARLLRR